MSTVQFCTHNYLSWVLSQTKFCTILYNRSIIFYNAKIYAAILFMSLLSIYTYYQRRSNNGSGGGNSKWKDGKAVGKNIKGVGDLPKPPKGG